MDGKRRWGWALGQSTLGLSRTVVGACCWGRLWSREAQGPVSPLALRARAFGPGRLSPRVGGGGSFGLKCCGGGGLHPAHRDAKRVTRYPVSGCMDAVCARL